MSSNDIYSAAIDILSARGDQLAHEARGPMKSSYSDPNYDYQKRHEYYEAHKELKDLKGRHHATTADGVANDGTKNNAALEKAKNNPVLKDKSRTTAADFNAELEKKKNDFLLKAKAEKMLRDSEHKNEHSISDATREAVTGKITDREYADKLKNDPEFAEATKAIREGKASNVKLAEDVKWREGDHTYGAEVDANKDAISYVNGPDETRDKMDKEAQEKNRNFNKKIEMLDKVRAEKEARTKGVKGFGDATEKALRGQYDVDDINRMVRTGPEYEEASKAIREGKTNSVNLAKINAGDGEEHIGRITGQELKDYAKEDWSRKDRK